MFDPDEVARNIALESLRSGRTAIDRIKADAAACEERHAACQGDDRKHPCPSYAHCYLGHGTNVFGQRIAPMPACPRSVLRVLYEMRRQLKALDEGEKA